MWVLGKTDWKFQLGIFNLQGCRSDDITYCFCSSFRTNLSTLWTFSCKVSDTVIIKVVLLLMIGCYVHRTSNSNKFSNTSAAFLNDIATFSFQKHCCSICHLQPLTCANLPIQKLRMCGQDDGQAKKSELVEVSASHFNLLSYKNKKIIISSIKSLR